MSVIPSLATKITGKFTPVVPLARIGRRNAHPSAQHIIPQCLVPHRETTRNQKKICTRCRQAIKSGRIRFVGGYLPPFAMAVIEQGRALCSMWSTGVFVEIAYNQFRFPRQFVIDNTAGKIATFVILVQVVGLLTIRPDRPTAINRASDNQDSYQNDAL